MNIIGISAFYHDSAACLVRDGRIIAAAQEERFTRKKHDASFPLHAARYCLREGDLSLGQIDSVVFYDKPLLKFERLLETYFAFAPRGLKSFLTAMPVWIHEKIRLKDAIRKQLRALEADTTDASLPEIFFTEHHEAHAASAFYPSPYKEAAVLCLDGVGEWATTSAWMGKDSRMDPLWEIPFPHSLGLLYSAFTYYTGFKVNSGEYKIMGLAPYGTPRYTAAIYDKLIDLKPDGTFHLNMEYFDYCTGLRMTNERFHRLFGGPPRQPESEVTEREMDLARSIQEVTEEVVLRLGNTLHRETGMKQLCMAGGVALNCVANGRLLREGPFDGIWIQPAAGDAGGAVGAALRVWYEADHERKRQAQTQGDAMQGSYLGPAFTDDDVLAFLDSRQIPHTSLTEDALVDSVARELADGKVVGWFHGRMEFGPVRWAPAVFSEIRVIPECSRR